MQPVDLIWTIVGFILTLMVFSYLFGDNPLFRLVTYLFVGVSAGFAAVMIDLSRSDAPAVVPFPGRPIRITDRAWWSCRLY
jgi:hypothetical protein